MGGYTEMSLVEVGCRVWIGFIWPVIGTCDGLLWTQKWNFGPYERRGKFFTSWA